MTNPLARWLSTGSPDSDGELTEESAADDTPEESAMSDAESEPAAGTPETDPLTVEDLEYRIDELESELESTTNAVQATQRGQDDIVDSIDELDGTVRRLLGVYDQLTNDANPFADGGGDGGRFGVVGDAADSAAADAMSTPKPDDAEADDATDEDATDAPEAADDDFFAPDDAEAEAEAEGEGDAETDDAGVEVDDASTTPEPNGVGDDDFDEADDTPDTGESVTFADLKEAADGRERDPEPAAHAVGDGVGEEALLTALGQGYATDVLVFEWLAMLVEESGPAGTLKAIDYYETVDWIDASVREHLEGALGGPEIDINVDPAEPRDLAAAHHADSYEYVLRLRELGRLDRGTHRAEAEG